LLQRVTELFKMQRKLFTNTHCHLLSFKQSARKWHKGNNKFTIIKKLKWHTSTAQVPTPRTNVPTLLISTTFPKHFSEHGIFQIPDTSVRGWLIVIQINHTSMTTVWQI